MAKKTNYAAKLSHRITLQSLVETEDGAGGYSSDWQSIATVWAQLIPLASGNNTGNVGESFHAMQLEARQLVRIIIRYREGVNATMRLVMGSRIFNIHQVVNKEEKNSILELIAEEGGAV